MLVKSSSQNKHLTIFTTRNNNIVDNIVFWLVSLNVRSRRFLIIRSSGDERQVLLAISYPCLWRTEQNSTPLLSRIYGSCFDRFVGCEQLGWFRNRIIGTILRKKFYFFWVNSVSQLNTIHPEKNVSIVLHCSYLNI